MVVGPISGGASGARSLLLLGGARLLGPAVIAAALERGWSVVVANRGSEPVGGYPAGVEHRRLDRGDRDAMRSLAELRPDAVVDLSCYEPEHAAIALEEFAGCCGRYLLMSTGAVYAESPLQPLTEATPATGRPLWGAYGEKKLRIEQIARSSALAEDMVVVRPPYIVGERDFMDRLPFIFDRVAAGATVFVPDSGKACVQLVSADDVAAACLVLLDAELSQDADGEPAAFNVGPPEWTTLNGLVELCAAAVRAPAPDVVNVPLARIGLSDAPYEWAGAIFPFADEHYVLDSRRLEAAGFAAYERLESLVGRLAGAYLASAPEREWERTANELRAQEELGLTSPEGRTSSAW